MISQNRQAAKDRIMAEEDFRVQHVAEDEIRAIITHLERQDRVMLHILAWLAHPEKAAKIARRVRSIPSRASTGHAGRVDGDNYD